MKRRPIKFRGRVCDENKAQSDQGKTVYGNCLFQYPNGTVALSHTIKLALTFVDPDNVAQLVGFDRDDKEVYEGDLLVDKEGNGFTARLVCRVLDDEGFLLDIPLEQLKLTEATT